MFMRVVSVTRTSAALRNHHKPSHQELTAGRSTACVSAALSQFKKSSQNRRFCLQTTVNSWFLPVTSDVSALPPVKSTFFTSAMVARRKSLGELLRSCLASAGVLDLAVPSTGSQV
jgi:hypothetical protein